MLTRRSSFQPGGSSIARSAAGRHRAPEPEVPLADAAGHRRAWRRPDDHRVAPVRPTRYRGASAAAGDEEFRPTRRSALAWLRVLASGRPHAAPDGRRAGNRWRAIRSHWRGSAVRRRSGRHLARDRRAPGARTAAVADAGHPRRLPRGGELARGLGARLPDAGRCARHRGRPQRPVRRA